MYQDYVANKAKEKTTQLEQYYSQVLSKVQTELNSILKVQSVCRFMPVVCKLEVLGLLLPLVTK